MWRYNTHAVGLSVAGARTQVPVVTRYSSDAFEEYQWVSGPRKLGVFLQNNVLGRLPVHLSEKMIALGPYGQSQLTSRGCHPDDVVILPPPAANDRFHPPDDSTERKRTLGISAEKTVVLYVGRLTELKGMEFLLNVLERSRGDPDLLFVLVGEGPYREQFERRFDDDLVRTVGHVAYDSIDRYYKAADCYVHPSRVEGLPLVVLEALECEVPVVARPAGDIGFATSNLVDTPAEMATVLSERRWDSSWKNREYFSSTYQRRTLRDVVESICS
jgi:glycosyltransferase involved in cell wall biosynthesis